MAERTEERDGAGGVGASGDVRPRPVMTPEKERVGEEGDIRSAKPVSEEGLRVRRAPFILGCWEGRWRRLVGDVGHAGGWNVSGRG